MEVNGQLHALAAVPQGNGPWYPYQDATAKREIPLLSGVIYKLKIQSEYSSMAVISIRLPTC